MNTAITALHRSTHVSVSAFGHVWEAWLPETPGDFVACKLPAPFDSWGSNTAWKLLSCDGNHSSSTTCEDSTLKACTTAETRRSRMLQNFNVVFGVVRNKAFASAFRAKKQAEAEAEAEEEEEELESPDEDEEEELDKEGDDDEEEEEAEEEEGEEDDVEEAAADDEEDDEEDEASVGDKKELLSSSSESEDEKPKPRKRGTKRSAPTK